MKKLLIALMLCAPMTMFAQKFGHIDSQALLMSLPEAVAVQNELQAKGNEYQKQLEDMQKELQTKAEAYDKAKATMPTAKQEETERELNDMYQKIQQTAQDNQKAFNDEQQRKLGPLLDKVRTAIASVAKAAFLGNSQQYSTEGRRSASLHQRHDQQGYHRRGEGRACQDEVSRRRIDPLCSQGQIDIGSVCP